VKRAAGALEVPDVDACHADAGGAALAAIRALMWEKAGLVRTAGGLREALTGIGVLSASLPPGAVEARNVAAVSRLLATAALARPESRGAHFRADYPSPDAAWRRRILLRRAGGPDAGTDAIRIELQPVPAPAAAAEAYA
jgi:L-aspartate oxidase